MYSAAGFMIVIMGTGMLQHVSSISLHRFS
jgi:hypothetical protein